MEVWIGDETTPRGAVGSLDDLLVEAGAPLRVRMVLEDDEELTSATLLLRGRTSSPPSVPFTAPELDSDAPTGFSGLTWATADWGSGRSVSRFRVRITGGGSPQLRLKIARGGSGWYSPPGPHSFAFDGSGNVSGSFPDTVADRLMVEFFDPVTGAPDTATMVIPLGTATVLPVTFDALARDPSVAFVGESPFFSHRGAIADQSGSKRAEVAVPNLMATIREQHGEVVRAIEVELEIAADAAGQLGIGWAFETVHHLEDFSGAPTLESAIDWAHTETIALLATTAEAHGVELRARWVPDHERVELAPDASANSPDLADDLAGAIVRPLRQEAQGFTARPTRAITGVDLWGRALPSSGEAVALTIDIVDDRRGGPDSTPLATATSSLARTNSSAEWLAIDLPEPLDPSAFAGERWWLVAHVDAGELLWVFSSPGPGSTRRADVTGPRYRRTADASLAAAADGSWLSRDDSDPESWALTRVRVREPEAAPTPTLTLLVDGAPVGTLVADRDDPDRWHLDFDDGSRPAGDSFALRVESAIAGALTLTELDLRWCEDVGGSSAGGSGSGSSGSGGGTHAGGGKDVVEDGESAGKQTNESYSDGQQKATG